MEVTFTVPALKAALRSVLPAVSKKPNLSILANLLISVNKGAITLRGTDLDLGLVVGVSGRANSDGQMLVPARPLSKFVNLCQKTGTVVVREQDFDGSGGTRLTRTIIESDSVSLVSTATSVNDFPKPRSLFKPQRQQIDFDAIRHVLPAASTDQGTPVICAVRIDGDQTAATDKYRLYATQSPTTVTTPLTIPRHAAVILAKIGGVQWVTHDHHMLQFQAEGFTLRTNLVQGGFPEWRAVVPTNTKPIITFKEDGFVRQIRRLAALAKGMPNPKETYMTFSDSNPLKVEVQSSGDERLDAVFLGGTTKTISFNCSYLYDVLRGADVTALYGGSGLQVVARWEADGYTHTRVLMPIRAGGGK